MSCPARRLQAQPGWAPEPSFGAGRVASPVAEPSSEPSFCRRRYLMSVSAFWRLAETGLATGLRYFGALLGALLGLATLARYPAASQQPGQPYLKAKIKSELLDESQRVFHTHLCAYMHVYEHIWSIYPHIWSIYAHAWVDMSIHAHIWTSGFAFDIQASS